MLLFLFLFFLFLLAGADKFTIGNQSIQYSDPLLLRRLAMYASGDAPSSGNKPHIDVKNLEFSTNGWLPVERGFLELFIIQTDTLDSLKELLLDCKQGFLRVGNHNPPPWRVKVEFDHSYKGQVERNATFYVQNTGNHFLVLSHCDLRLGDVVFFSGPTEWMNPYGYLPGRLYPLLPFYTYLTVTYLVVGFVWFVLNVRYWKDVVQLQNLITFVLGLCMAEMATWYFEYASFNTTGTRHIGAIVMAMLISVFRRAVSRVLVVAVSLGWGVVRPSLGDDGWKLIALGSVYMVFESALELVTRYAQTNDVSKTWRTILVFPPAAINAMFYWWIFFALDHLTVQLKTRKQDEKLLIYTQFRRVLICSLLFALAYAAAQNVYVHAGWEETHWQYLWLFDTGFAEIIYTGILFAILFLWQPSNNNKRFAYAQISPSEGDEEEHGVLPEETHPELHAGTTKDAEKAPSKPRFTINEDERDMEQGEEEEDEEDEEEETPQRQSQRADGTQGTTEMAPLHKLD